MGTGMPLGAQGFHGCAPTNYNSKAPVENFKTVFSFTDCLLNASPILSPCFASYKQRRTSVSREDGVCTEKIMGKLSGWSSPESGGEWSYKPVGGQLQVEFLGAHYLGQSCLISLLMIWMSGRVYPK